jgi:enoyl-CoA hydratase
MTEQTVEKVLYEVCEPRIARITLNRPGSRNAQDTELLYALNAAFDRAAQDDEVRVIVLAANGPHFSSGHDLREHNGDAEKIFAEMYRHARVGTWSGFREKGAEAPFAREMELYFGFCERWRNLPKPTIAQVQGKVIAGGLMLVWPCDLIVASEDAMFQDNTVAMGICGAEFFAHPWELGIRRAKEFLFTSEWLTAHQAEAFGMVNRVVPREELAERTLELARSIARKSSFALKVTKEAVNLAQDAQGRQSAMRGAFGLHHMLHSHWMQQTGLPIDPEFIAQSTVIARDSALRRS